MLARTLKNNLKNLNTHKMRTKATKFSSMFSTEPTTENSAEIRQCLARDNYDKVSSEDKNDDDIFDELYDVTPEEVAEYIVEDPKEVQVEFPIQSAIKLESEMPFFRAISYKLGGQKLVNI